MSLFFFSVELLFFIGAGYLFLYKKDLAVLYFPAMVFARAVIVSVLPAMVEYAFFSLYIGFLIYHNPTFYRKNIFALLLFILHVLLIPGSSDIVFIRPTLFSVLWMLLLVPLVMSVLEKYTRQTIFKELSNSALIILALFITNVVFSTVFKYSPHDMYGLQSGILYGELVDTDFNILAVTIFIAFLFLTYKMNPYYLLFTLLSLSAIGLSMRRSVIGACLMGMAIILLILIMRGQATQILKTCGVIAVVGIAIVLFTDFTSIFQERFEQRNLANRELAEESRFVEYALLYRDAYVHHDFNPWIGYELLNSGGNYGKAIFGPRTLHGDITHLVHSTGIIGLILYILMVSKVFWEAVRNIQTPTDRLIILFCFLIFAVFTITGRYTQTGYMVLLFLLLSLPLGQVGHIKRVIGQQRVTPHIFEKAKTG